MTYTVYGVCKVCGQIVSKDETTMSGEGEQDGESYLTVPSSQCSCKGKKPKTVDTGRAVQSEQS